MGVEDELSSRVAALRDSPAYSNYTRVRQEVLRMLDASRDASDDTPSAYWAHELRNFEYMLDASPLIIESLRQHTFHLTGVRTYEYRPGSDKARRRFEAKLRMLVELEGDALLVPEARELGGFGHELDGALYNIDTLKFFEVLIALERGAVLEEIRSPGRKLVWEIGAGWGGFAYQFKSLFPDVTYVIVDLPELFLFSATYLMTLFPDAKVHFHADGDAIADWEGVDFAFVPARASDALRGLKPDLAVNMVSFQEMTTEQVDGYGRLAWELGCPRIYSLNRDRSPWNAELRSVREVLGRYYWLHEVPLLDLPYTRLPELRTPTLPERAVQWGLSALGRDLSVEYRHVVGWRRDST
jgi:putative sugar O-methyltransferase